MATEPEPPLDPDVSLAVRVLLYGAVELPIEACREPVRNLVAHIALATENFSGDIVRRRPEPERMAIKALRELAASFGRSPSSSEYLVEFERRRDGGEEPIPSPSAIVKRFGSWQAALTEAGLALPELSRVNVRRYVGKKRVLACPVERILECLRACARDLGYPPTIRDYNAWRDEKLGGSSGRRRAGVHIPHYRTIEDRFGGWGNALSAAGLDPAPDARRASFKPV